MAFDRKRAEEMVVDILDGLEGDRVVGMGFRLFGQVIVTACHCLPHRGGKVILRDPDERDPAPSLVRVRQPGTDRTALAAIRSADPCSALALLCPPDPESQLPSGPIVPLADLAAARAPAQLELNPFPQGSAFVYTHEKRWIEGIFAGSWISIWRPGDRLRVRSSGAPVFNKLGRVVGLVGKADIRLPDAPLCMLADRLPGWALREARDAANVRGGAVAWSA